MKNNDLLNLIKALYFLSDKFRDLVNGKARKASESDFYLRIKSGLGLSSSEDWGFLCAAMDIFDDSLCAIENFSKFGMSGPTKYDDLGEKYLRMYGLLNATYLQQAALLKLIVIARLNDKVSLEKRVNSLDIRSVRNKLGSHSVDYQNFEQGRRESYVPDRSSIGSFSCGYYNNSDLKDRGDVNLLEALLQHLQCCFDFYILVYEKLGRFIHKTSPVQLEELSCYISDAKRIVEGGWKVESEDGSAVMTTDILP